MVDDRRRYGVRVAAFVLGRKGWGNRCRMTTHRLHRKRRVGEGVLINSRFLALPVAEVRHVRGGAWTFRCYSFLFNYPSPSAVKSRSQINPTSSGFNGESTEGFVYPTRSAPFSIVSVGSSQSELLRCLSVTGRSFRLPRDRRFILCLHRAAALTRTYVFGAFFLIFRLRGDGVSWRHFTLLGWSALGWKRGSHW